MAVFKGKGCDQLMSSKASKCQTHGASQSTSASIGTWIIVLIMGCSAAPTFSESIINVPSIAGKSKAEISKLIGNATFCIFIKYGEKCVYSRRDSEIVFINDRADWITIEGIDDVPFDSHALESIGIQTQKPTFQDNSVMRWSGIAGLQSVSIFKNGDTCDYAIIKAYTE